MIDGRNLFDQPIRNGIKAQENIRKIATGQEDNYTTGCFLDCPYFQKKTKRKWIAIYLCKQNKYKQSNADQKAINQTNFIASLYDA